MKYGSAAFRLCAIGFLLTSVSSAAPSAEVPLKIINKSSKVATGNAALLGPPSYTLSLRNDSAQTITAWKLSCLYAEGNGEFGTGSLLMDGFQPYERDTQSTTGGGVVRPGAEIDVVVREKKAVHPFDATTCRVDAVLYADGSFAGESKAIASLVGKRVRFATETSRAIEILEQVIAERPSPDSSIIERVESELLRGTAHSDILDQALQAIQVEDSVRLDELLALVRKEYELVEKHLRVSHRRDTPTPFGKSSANLPSKWWEVEGCTIGGGSTGITSQSCDEPSEKKRLDFNVTAACRNVCTGETWQVSSPTTAVATGVCPTCDVFFEEKDKHGPDGYSTVHYWSNAYSKIKVSVGCLKNGLAEARATCNCPGCGKSSPILISLSDERYELTDAAGGVRFDLDGDGKPEQTAWTAIGSDEAFLALDRNLNGYIDDFMEIFGDHTPQLPSNEPNGWLALAVWDDSLNGGNEDGIIDVNDYIFTALQLWVDKNHNGFSEREELSSLEAAGVESLDLDYRRSHRVDEYGNAFRFPSEVSMASSVSIAWDVFFVRE